jgi:hypothetical protein
MERFRGFIAGLGTSAGRRLVAGHWMDSPLGAFTDVMTEDRDGLRTLLAPNRAVADYVSATYRFAEVVVAPLDASLSPAGERSAEPGNESGTASLVLRVSGGPLELRADLGPVPALGRMLQLVPAWIAVHPAWLTAVNRAAGILVPGVATVGSAGGGRREYYGVRSIRGVERVAASWDRAGLGRLAPVDPPVHFGFSSVPRTPQAVAVTTTILPPAAEEGPVAEGG